MAGRTRRQKIEAMLADDPEDVFLRYGVAIELEKEGEVDRSLDFFRGLMHQSTPYVPAFFMCGQMLTRLSRIEEARTVLRSGIDEARTQGNAHAAGEMAEFLATLGDY